VRDEWSRLAAATEEAREEALRRHAPEAYRSAVAEAVLDD
jgi:hypothetical protein